jgi:hypothetical protein
MVTEEQIQTLKDEYGYYYLEYSTLVDFFVDEILTVYDLPK